MNGKNLIMIISIVCILAVMLCIPAFAAYTVEDGADYYLSTYNSMFLPYTEDNIAQYPVERRFTSYSVLFFDDIYDYPVYDLLGDETMWYYVSDAIVTDLFTLINVASDVYFPAHIHNEDGFITVTTNGDLDNLDDWLIFCAKYADNGLPAGVYIRAETMQYIKFIAITPPVTTEPSLFDTVGSIVGSSVSWISSFVFVITNNALLLCFVIIAFCGFGIGLFSRLKR